MENTLPDKISSYIIENKKDEELVCKVASMLEDFTVPYSDIQVGKLILNDNEYPTEYSKAQQSKLELVTRYHNIVNMYYDIKKKELEIQLKEEEINELNSSQIKKDNIKAQISELDKEQLVLQINSIKAKLKSVLKEMQLYYKYYNINNGKKLTDEEREILEVEFWKQKAMKNPVTFEDRYGSEYMKSILGDKYPKYYNLRTKIVGLLPSEMIK